MDPFEKVEIGCTGVQVTRLGLGGAPLSGMVLADGIYQGSAYDQSLKIIQRAYDLGIRYFDTAPLYGEGRSEIHYGRVLGGLERASFSISTKVSRLLIPADPADLSPYSEDGLPHYNIQFDFSRDGILRSLEESLERLHFEAVDVLYLHDSDFVGQHRDEDFAAGLSTLVELRRQGVVKANRFRGPGVHVLADRRLDDRHAARRCFVPLGHDLQGRQGKGDAKRTAKEASSGNLPG